MIKFIKSQMKKYEEFNGLPADLNEADQFAMQVKIIFIGVKKHGPYKN